MPEPEMLAMATWLASAEEVNLVSNLAIYFSASFRLLTFLPNFHKLKAEILKSYDITLLSNWLPGFLLFVTFSNFFSFSHPKSGQLFRSRHLGFLACCFPTFSSFLHLYNYNC